MNHHGLKWSWEQIITCLRGSILSLFIFSFFFKFVFQAKRLRYTVENKVKTFLSTCPQVRCSPQSLTYFIIVMYVSAMQSDIVTDSQALVEEGLLLIHEEIHGKMGERLKERKKGFCTREHINLSILAMTTAVLQTYFYVLAPYLSPCSRCHTTGTAKADLAMLHPGQTFLTLLLANLSVHTLLLIFYHQCWLLLLLLLNLFVINLVFS